MDTRCRPRIWAAGDLRMGRPPKFSLFMTIIAVSIVGAFLIQPVSSQQHSLINTPPILYVPERNWRISETEKVGQIISRIRAGDPENDELVFGLEPHFLSSYPNSDSGDSHGKHEKLPFRIDPVSGIVYLNESLIGRGGENFFLYITVSDGVLTAKNEVFVNILSADSDNNANYRTPPSITSVVQNISQILPPFDTLPGVQSIRNQLPNQRPSNNLPPGFGLSPDIFKPNRPNTVGGHGNNNNGYRQPPLNFQPNHQLPNWSASNPDDSSDERDNDISTEDGQQNTATVRSPTTSRTKLTPIVGGRVHPTNASQLNKVTVRPSLSHQGGVTADSNAGVVVQDVIHSTPSSPLSATYSIKATMIPLIIAACGLFVAAAVIFGFLYRKRLCAISKTLKKKSKEEMAKKSNQSNLSSNLTDDSRNSMVLQHWNGPIAYGNRYVPWERDQQLIQSGMATSQLSTSVVNGGVLGGTIPIPSAPGGGVASAPSGDSSQNKYDRWEFPRHRLKFFNILGEGAFGQVWRCEAIDVDGIEGVSTVAVKTLKENATEVEKKDLISELEVMKSLEPHVNVVRLLGCCTDKDPMFVIIEYVNRGKLQTYLRSSRAERHYGNTHGKSNILTSGDLTSFMYQVAKGMDYLTSRGIIHRDLAARNILISDDHTCKVADFGFARDVITSKIYERKSEGKLPIRWMAIESLYDNIFSVKSDIWSFGILMWEIVTLGSTPYPGISAADVMRKVRDGYRLEKPEHCRRELYNIMYYCWSNDPNERPTFSEIVQMLDKLLHTEMDYIELERFPDHNYYNIVNPSGEKV